jgi:Domain of unknown function (DUF4286)
MATVLFMVKASITKEREAAFNRWYNEEHCPQVLRFGGVRSARRFKALMGEGTYQYLAVYEFEDEPTFQRFLDSDHLRRLIRDYDASFGEVGERRRLAYTEIWP